MCTALSHLDAPGLDCAWCALVPLLLKDMIDGVAARCVFHSMTVTLFLNAVQPRITTQKTHQHRLDRSARPLTPNGSSLSRWANNKCVSTAACVVLADAHACVSSACLALTALGHLSCDSLYLARLFNRRLRDHRPLSRAGMFSFGCLALVPTLTVYIIMSAFSCRFPTFTVASHTRLAASL